MVYSLFVGGARRRLTLSFDFYYVYSAGKHSSEEGPCVYAGEGVSVH